ncbi:MAG: transcription termination factor Rho [Thermodesulfobacteriota bacterium]
MAEEEQQEKELDRMTVKDLRAIASEETDLVGVHAMKKAELLEAIKTARGITEEKAPKKKTKKEEVTVSGLKGKIADLKEKKEEFRKAKNKRMVEILRRKINRAKKKTRQIARV